MSSWIQIILLSIIAALIAYLAFINPNDESYMDVEHDEYKTRFVRTVVSDEWKVSCWAIETPRGVGLSCVPNIELPLDVATV